VYLDALPKCARHGMSREALFGTVLADGDVLLLLAAGTGYTWAASVVGLGPAA
jgi:hypothetical protein